MDNIFELNDEQKQVLQQIKDFVYSNDSVFILRGCAGTGKTTLLGRIVKWLNDEHLQIQLMSPTGRAATILKSKTGINATTIHRGIYDFDKITLKQNSEDDLSDMDVHFNYPLKKNNEKLICIVDEGSMLGNKKHETELWTFGTSKLLDDLLTYSLSVKGSKLIVVGDPIQLPPVGENKSSALCDEFYSEKGLGVRSANLNVVMRQSGESSILKNAEMVRSVSLEGKFNKLVFEDNEDIKNIDEDSLYKLLRIGEIDKILCYANKTANDYNKAIRKNIYDVDDNVLLRQDEILIVVSNHYDRDNSNVQPLDIMNGEFVKVADVPGEEEIHRNIPVFVTIDGEKKKIYLDLGFIDVLLMMPNGQEHKCKLLTKPLLNSDKGALTIVEIKALYIDFCIRHSGLKNGSTEFKNAILTDPYINALKVKYGYAITCHKSQGGEWKNVAVDFFGISVNQDKIRWIYTAITRASEKLYMLNAPKVTPTDKLSFHTITKVGKIHNDFPTPVTENVESPFHKAEDPSFLKAKYVELKTQIEAAGYSIVNVISSNYLERYIIDTGNGVMEELNLWYNGKNVFTRKACKNEDLLRILETRVAENCKYEIFPDFQYEPVIVGADALWNLMNTATEKCGVKIVGVKEQAESYCIDYLLKTSGNYSWIKFYVNTRGMLTIAMPYSDMENDTKLQELINYITNNK